MRLLHRAWLQNLPWEREEREKKKVGGSEFWFCNENPDCIQTMGNNSIAFGKINSASQQLREQVLSNLDSRELDFWKELINDLENFEQESILHNIHTEPRIHSIFLDAIKQRIEGADGNFLNPSEKETLKEAYTMGNGNFENTINEKSAAFFSLIAGQKLKKTKEDFVKNKLKTLDGWDLLDESKKKEIIDIVLKSNNVSNFTEVLNETTKAIKKIKQNPLPPTPNPQLVSTKQKIQSQYKLSSAEFNSVIKPLTDLELLQAVAKLINKVKTNSPTTDSDTRLEFLVAYQAAPSGSLKNQAYQAVNSYQQQVDHLISSLQAQKTKRKSSLRELVQALDEQALNQAYQLIQQDPELYQAQNKSLIDNHQKRVASALQITAQNQASPLAQDLATILRTIVASDSSKEDLLSLEQKIKEYQTAQGEKQVLYQQHSSIINQMVQEIKTELTRRHNSEEEQQDNPPPSSHTTPQPTSPLTIFLITLTGITLLLTISYLYWQKKKKQAK